MESSQVVVPPTDMRHKPRTPPKHNNARNGRSRSPPVLAASLSNISCNNMIVDYDANPTALYKLLESSEWDLSRIRCQTHPAEVQTWVVRRDRSSGHVRWRLLPLHAAVIFRAPSSVVEALLSAFPEGAALQDDQGMLPLHLAFRNNETTGSNDVVPAVLDMLLEKFPEGIHVKDKRGRIPLAHGRDVANSATFMKRYSEAAVQVEKTRVPVPEQRSPSPSTSGPPRPETPTRLRTASPASAAPSTSPPIVKSPSNRAPSPSASSGTATSPPIVKSPSSRAPSPAMSARSAASALGLGAAVKQTRKTTKTLQGLTVNVSPDVAATNTTNSTVALARSQPMLTAETKNREHSIPASVHAKELRLQSEAHNASLARLKSEHQLDLAALQEDYEARISDLRSKHDDNLEETRNAFELKIVKHQDEIKTMKEDMAKKHDDQMDALRSTLANETKQKMEVNAMLREEVDDLREALEKSQSENEMLNTIMAGMKVQNEKLTESVRSIMEEQEQLMVIVYRQREEAETAHAVRDKLIQTLLAQEDEDRAGSLRNGDEIVDLAEVIRGRVEEVLAEVPGPELNFEGTDGLEGVEEYEEEERFGGIEQSLPSNPHHNNNEGGMNRHDDISAITEYTSY